MSSESTLPFIVGIGASAGGLEPIETFFDHMPVDTGMVFVVVQHLSPDFKSLMDELLARHTIMPVHWVEESTTINPDSVYLIPPKMNLHLEGNTLRLTEIDTSGGLNLPIDIFFHSLASEAGDRSIAVVLSGTGSDGSRGIRSVSKAGGVVFAQSVGSAKFDGMPRHAIETGVVDTVCAPDQMPGRILDYISSPENYSGDRQPQRTTVESEPVPATKYAEVYTIFQELYGIDFTLYKPSTIERRLERRIQLTNCDNYETYLSRYQSDRKELAHLYRDLLVEVTEFFRDPAAFDELEQKVVVPLVTQIGDREQLRVWVPGCATGEEAYSVAILFQKVASTLGKRLRLKVFASDVYRDSIEIASTGEFKLEQLGSLSDKLIESYFTKRGDRYRIANEIRQHIVFTPHDLTRDPPFTRLDLICCRNVLIYFTTNVQRRVLSAFHFGLRDDGHLFLGSSETVAPFNDSFHTVHQHSRIFRKIRGSILSNPSSISLQTPTISSIGSSSGPSFSRSARRDDRQTIADATTQLLSRYVPPSLLVDESFDLLHTFGEARKRLIQPEGRTTLNVLRMVEGDLRTAMSGALHRAKRERDRVVVDNVRHHGLTGEERLSLIAEPLQDADSQLFLITFEYHESPDKLSREPREFSADEESLTQLAALERELEHTRESLQTTVEELETSNEELQSTNEELIASNEELQSTNEELHGVNEELYTVNSEHQRKIEELLELSADMDNLLRSTDIGTMFVDQELRMRKFTPAMTTYIHLLDRDVGRPIEHLAHNLKGCNVVQWLKETIDSNESKEHEVTTTTGGTVLCRLLPYRLDDDSVDGAVMTVLDITRMKRAEREAEQKAVELHQQNRELEQFRKLAIGREHRMIELKGEINELCRTVGAEPRYDLTELVEPAAAVEGGRKGLYDNELSTEEFGTGKLSDEEPDDE